MSEKQADAPEESSEKTLDLSILNEFDFGPSWADENPGKKSLKGASGQKPHRKQSRGSGKSDRRSHPGNRHSGSDKGRKTSSGEPKSFNGEVRRNRNQPKRDYFQPTVDVNIYPQDETFEALIKRLRSTVRTYQLFEIAHLILEKPERYVIVVKNKAKEDEKPAPLYYTVPNHLPFETEDAAINHFLNNHLDSLFDVEVIDVEPPKGNFQMVNRCTITGELLGAPNYHRYQEFLKRHYASRINNMSFDHFVSKIESVKEQESIDAWIESMKKGARYTLKEPKEGEPESFESLRSVRSFLVQNRKDAIVGSSETVRFAGREMEHFPKSALRRSIEMYIEQQLQFPLDTANNIRGRLRRHHFTVYKKGSKGISYVCAVKRKFRDSKTVFTESIQELIDFIEKNPEILAAKLPKLYLGIDAEKRNPEKLKIAESEVPAEKASIETVESTPAAPEEMNERTEVSEVVEPVSKDTTVSKDSIPEAKLKEEDTKRLNQLMLDLRWLITEGYVTEYYNGCLFAAPIMPGSQSKS